MTTYVVATPDYGDTVVVRAHSVVQAGAMAADVVGDLDIPTETVQEWLSEGWPSEKYVTPLDSDTPAAYVIEGVGQ